MKKLKTASVLCVLCLLALMLSCCKSQNKIKNPFFDFDSSKISSVRFFNQKGGYDMDEEYKGKEAVDKTLDYLRKMPILHETIKLADGDFVLGDIDRFISFCDENGKVIYSVNVLLYNLDTEMYGKAGSFYICYADRPEISAAHYTVPSEYVETIVDYMKEIALENFKETTHVVS